MQENPEFSELCKLIGMNGTSAENRESIEQRIALFRQFLPFFSAEKQKKINRALQLTMMFQKKASDKGAREKEDKG